VRRGCCCAWRHGILKWFWKRLWPDGFLFGANLAAGFCTTFAQHPPRLLVLHRICTTRGFARILHKFSCRKMPIELRFILQSLDYLCYSRSNEWQRNTFNRQLWKW
jgi:hypothetical protein